VLAGGLGKRLRSVYSRGPKCMAPVGGRLFLEYLLLLLRSAGIREVIMCVGYKRSQLESWLGNGSRWGVNLTFSVERTLLGTGGALKLAEDLITSDCFFVLNGDSFLDVDLQGMYRHHMAHRALATVAIVSQPRSARYGTVEIAANGKITSFHEKSSEAQLANTPAQLINGGIYLFQRQFLDLIPRSQVVSLEQEIFPRIVPAGLCGFVTNSYFIDIGVPQDFERAQTELPKRFRYDYTS
jgi:D-glycero-alpha-D-manno-heptose 1-phosphate guanylyltransferase